MCKLFHYCLMRNHIHLFGQVTTGGDLPKIMQHLLLQYSVWYRQETGYVGHVWQGHYIKRNPSRAKMVAVPGDYVWSSYRYYAFGKADVLVDHDPYHESLGSTPKRRQMAYREFVERDRLHEVVARRRCPSGGPVGPAF
jgi:putative transposase